ncbi:MAG: hypothetical protein E6248_15510 [Clostridium sp.]|uniref:hypothetical protein n=1 Tax=Clostridium sp. TaxID=1506 RepID=UPI00290B2693|nr:hypothetical protein [Clostridium sp.]MDU5111845.1 hypothetical protein [Clostridium sp.]
MWIRTQSKKELVKVFRVEISSIIGDERNKVLVWSRFAPNSLFSSNRTLLGMYPTMEDAISEIDEIEKCI